MGEVRVQGPWAYAYRIDLENNIEFMATTPALEDGKILLLLSCKDSQRINISVVNPSGFAYSLTVEGHIIVQLDGAAGISLPSNVVQQKLIQADPATTKQLIPIIMRSDQLSISTLDTEGVTHAYTFLLQPNSRALRDIDNRCLFE
jgi:hypothetical protein